MAGIKKNFFFNSVLSVSQVLFPLITYPYASRILLPEGIGAVSFIDNFTLYFIVMAALGIPVYGVREIAKVQHDKDKLKKVFSELLLIHFFTTLLILLVYWLIVMNTSKLLSETGLCRIGAGIILSNVFLVEWFYQGIEAFRFIALRSLCIKVITVALLFVLVKTSADKEVYYALTLGGIIVNAIINLFSARQYISLQIKSLAFGKHIKPLLIILSTNIVISVYVILSTVLLGFLSTNKIVGYYSTSIRISKFSLAIVGMFGVVLIPRLSHLFNQAKTEETAVLLEKSLQVSLLLSIPIAVGTFCLSKELVLLFAGAKFLQAVPALQILSGIVIIIGVAQVYSQQILVPSGKEIFVLIASSAGMVLSVILNLLLIPVSPQAGAATASLVTECIVTALLLYFANRHIKVHFPLKNCLYSFFTCLAFFPLRSFAAYYTDSSAYITIVTITTGSLFYFLFQLFVWKNSLLTGYTNQFLKQVMAAVKKER